MKDIMGIVGVGIVVIVVGLGLWKLERWVNWKLSYGNKVDGRIEQLEKRVEALEAKGTTL